MRYSDLAVVWGKERSHLCLCWINSPPASQRCIVQINELSIKATRLSPLKDRGLEGERSGFCPVSHPLALLPPALLWQQHLTRSHAWGSRIRDQGVSHLQFSRVQKNKVPSSADGTVSLFPKTERRRGARRERNTERPPLVKSTVFGEWGDDPPSPHRDTRLMD